MSLSEETLLALLRLVHKNSRCYSGFDTLCAQMRRQLMLNQLEKSNDAISFPDDADIRINGRRIYPPQYSGSWAQPAPKGMSGAEKIIYLSGWAWGKASETAPEATPPFGKEEAQARSDIKNSSRQTPAKETGTDGCDIRYPTQQSTKHQQTAAPQPQADLSFPQEGQAVLSISESLPDTSSSPINSEPHPTDSQSTGCVMRGGSLA